MPIQIHKNLIEIRNDVLNLRVGAANTSLWSIAASMSDRVDRAINDALMAYPFMIRATAFSIRFSPGTPSVILPSTAENIMDVYAYHASDCTTKYQINEYRHVPTVWTNFLNVEIPQYALETSIAKANPIFWMGVEYEYRQRELPPPQPLTHNINPTQRTIRASRAGELTHYWPEEGFVALVPTNGTVAYSKYEVVSYGERYVYANKWNPLPPGSTADIDASEIGITENEIFVTGSSVDNSIWSGWKGLTRAKLGTYAHSWHVTNSVWITPVMVLPPEAYAVVILEAQANMYQYWVAHRTAYDQWAAGSQIQQMDTQDILTLVATLRKQAQEKYVMLNKPQKKAPVGPTFTVLERRKGTGV